MPRVGAVMDGAGDVKSRASGPVRLGTNSVFPPQSMKGRPLTLLFLLYVSLDLSSPFIPGAFNFNPDESVDAVWRYREGAGRRLAVQWAPTPPPRLDSDAGARPGAFADRPVGLPRHVDEWLVDVRRAHAPVPEVSTLSEDH